MHPFLEEREMSIKTRVISLLSVGDSHLTLTFNITRNPATFIQGRLHPAPRITRSVKSPWSSLLTLSFLVSHRTMVSLPQDVVENATLEVSAAAW